MTVAIASVHKNEKYYSRACEFIPERFTHEDPFPNDLWKKEPYSYIPFSAGPKNCLGQHMAILEAKIVLSLFIRTFNFEFPKDYQLKMTQKFVYDVVDPLLATLTPL